MAGNQHQPDPRQLEFLKLYTDPKSETFANIYQTAIKVGYSEEYAKNMNAQVDWISEGIRDQELVKQARVNLKEYVTFTPEDTTDKKIKFDATKFVLGTIGNFNETKTVVLQEKWTPEKAKDVLNALNDDTDL